MTVYNVVAVEGLDGTRSIKVPPGMKLYQVSVLAAALFDATVRIGNQNVITIPAGSSWTLSGSDTPDMFDSLTEVAVTRVDPTCQAVVAWGTPSNVVLSRMAELVCRELNSKGGLR